MGPLSPGVGRLDPDTLLVPRTLDDPPRPFPEYKKIRLLTKASLLMVLGGMGLAVLLLIALHVPPAFCILIGGYAAKEGSALHTGYPRDPLAVWHGWWVRRLQARGVRVPAWLQPRAPAPARVVWAAEVTPIIVEAHDPHVLYRQGAQAIGALLPGTRLRLVTIGQSHDIEAVLQDLAARQRAAPAGLDRLGAADRAWMRAQYGQSYVPDLRHYLVLEAEDEAQLAQVRSDLVAGLGLDLRTLSDAEIGDLDLQAAGARDRAEEAPAWVRHGDRLWAARGITVLPGKIKPGWSRPLVRLRFPVRIEALIEGRDQAQELGQLEDRANETGGVLQAQQQGVGRRDTRMSYAEGEIGSVLEMMTAGTQLVGFGLCVRTSVSLESEGEGEGVLLARLRAIESALRTATMSRAVRTGRHDQARLVAGDMPLYRTLDVAAGAFMPWQRPAPGQATGLFVGETESGALVRYDPRQTMTGTAAVVGVQGAGKTLFAQWLALQRLLECWPVVVLDSSGSWRHLCQAAGGLVWPLREGLEPPVPWTWERLRRAPFILLETNDLPEGTERAAYEVCWRVMREVTAVAQARGGNAFHVIDEGWAVMKQSGAMVQTIGRKARHGDLHVLLITQQLSDALDDPDGVKFFTSVPMTFVFRSVDERIGHGAGLAWMDRVFGPGAAEIITGLRKTEDWSEMLMLERDPAKSVLQRGVVRVRPSPYDLRLFGSYRWEREDLRRRAEADGHDLIAAAIALGSRS